MASYECHVARVGPSEDGAVNILLREQTNPPKFTVWLKANERVKREMLSVALAALGGGRRVQAIVPDSPKEGDTIDRLYML